MSEVQTLLQLLDAHVVDGPSSVGAYAIDVPAGRSADALDTLRADARVRFAGPALAGAQQ